MNAVCKQIGAVAQVVAEVNQLRTYSFSHIGYRFSDLNAPVAGAAAKSEVLACKR
jgi:hypothetical protein